MLNDTTESILEGPSCASDSLILAPRKFYISDTHFMHKGILRHASRPFSDVYTMNDALIQNWNNRVSRIDDVHFLGDFCFRGDDEKAACLDILENRLNGNLHLVIGNHDPQWIVHSRRWKSVNQILETTDNGQKIVLCHYPFEEWNRMIHGSIHMFGHIHENVINSVENRYCVCVEKIGYEPKTLSEVLAIAPK